MEYMGPSEESWSQYYKLYKNSFSGIKFDCVISLDDNAFNFLLKHGEKLFPNTPVVFCGINNFTKSIISNHPLFTGLAKSSDIERTINIALRLHPHTKEIFVVTDISTGIDCKNIIEGLIPLYNNKVNFTFSNENTITKLKNKIKQLPKDAIIYFDVQLKDDDGRNISETKTVGDFLKNCKIPIYSKSNKQLKSGTVGGMITNSEDLGREVGQLALRILNGEKPYNIPVVEDSAHNYAFNYNKLKQFHIDLKILPKGSQIISNSPSAYLISKKLILYIITGIIMIFILGFRFIKFNIRKRKFAERLLYNSEELLNTLINSTPNIVYFKSPEGKFIEVNNTALDILDINKNNYRDICELSDTPIKTKALLTKWANKDEEAWSCGKVYRSEETILDKKENIDKIYDTLRIPLFNDDGTRQGLILFGLDITERKTNEKNEQLIKELMYYDKLKTDFFSNISHELKTPLNLIFSALQIIELKNNSYKQKQGSVEKYTNIMRQNCYRLLRIIENLIDITKIDAGYFFIQRNNKDVVNVVENIVLSVVDYVESKGMSIIFDTEVEEKIMAFDPDAMERIILNLLSNAIKFTPSGGSIEVNIYDKVDSIIISVKDTGLGIPTEKQSLIFNKFVQVDKSLSRNREGSGIGLSLVKELVTLHGGTIELEGDMGHGSDFRIELPVILVNEEENLNKININTNEDKVERRKIEFSDIYT